MATVTLSVLSEMIISRHVWSQSLFLNFSDHFTCEMTIHDKIRQETYLSRKWNSINFSIVSIGSECFIKCDVKIYFEERSISMVISWEFRSTFHLILNETGMPKCETEKWVELNVINVHNKIMTLFTTVYAGKTWWYLVIYLRAACFLVGPYWNSHKWLHSPNGGLFLGMEYSSNHSSSVLSK